MTPTQHLFVDENHDIVFESEAVYLVEIVRDEAGQLLKETWVQMTPGEVPGPGRSNAK